MRTGGGAAATGSLSTTNHKWVEGLPGAPGGRPSPSAPPLLGGGEYPYPCSLRERDSVPVIGSSTVQLPTLHLPTFHAILIIWSEPASIPTAIPPNDVKDVKGAHLWE